jgi:alkanesulfonate monooxygenase SsuD/methylene tetrahydromethanopterin reductase-like flavin-dependent oxidoreductase (luciferase family)
MAATAVGISLPTSFADGPVSGQHLVDLGCAADERGFSTISCGDHLLWNTPILDPVVVLSLLAGVTERSALMTGVLLAPLRHPLWLAKLVNSLQHVSGERLVLGLGAGGELPYEFQALGEDPARRGARLETAIAFLGHVLHDGDGGGTVPGPNGRRLVLGPAHRRVPVWLGGRSTAALGRAARCADGWLGLFHSPESFARVRDGLVDASAAAGRATPVKTGMQIFACQDDDEVRGRQRVQRFIAGHFGYTEPAIERHVVTGSRAALEDGIVPFLDAGADFVQLHLVGGAYGETLDALSDVLGKWLPAPPLHRT